MDAHSHTLDKFSIYRLFDDAQNVKYDTKSGHACECLVPSYQSWHAVQPNLQHIHHCAFFQNAQDFLQHLHHVVASFYLALQNYRGLNEFLQVIVDQHKRRLV